MVRYQTTINRQLEKDIEQLERLQAKRAAEATLENESATDESEAAPGPEQQNEEPEIAQHPCRTEPCRTEENSAGAVHRRTGSICRNEPKRRK